MSGRAALALLLAAFALSPIARADCVDPQEKERLLAAKRGRRADERDFVKQARHELSVQGGYLASDLLDGTYLVGVAYTYHLTEDAAVEASVALSQLRSSVAQTLEHDRAVTILPPEDRVLLFFTDLIWAPLHGKMQLFSGTIAHFDLYTAIGVGVVDNSSSYGAAGQFGFGGKIFLGRSWALRIDVRDHLYQQQILAVRQYVQDFALTAGVSLFLPTGL